MDQSMVKKVRFFQLQKQHLLNKVSIEDYLLIIRENIGLHSTDYLTPYLSLWARVENFDPHFLFDDLNKRRAAVRVRAFRGTVFVVHRDDLEQVLVASKLFLANILKNNYAYATKQNVDFKTLDKNVIRLLSQYDFLSAGEIRKKLTGKVNTDHLPIAMRMLDLKGIIARTQHKHLLDNRTQYALMKNWVTDLNPGNFNPDSALEVLIFNYIKNFGPVCGGDICWWFPITKTLLRKILEKLENKIDELLFNSNTYWMEKEDYKQFLNFKLPKLNTPLINFLPYEDHFPKAYIQRNWHISEKGSSLVYVKEKKTDYGQIRPSIWLNGEIIGRWEYEWVNKKKSAVKVEIKNIKDQVNEDKVLTDLVESKRKELEDYMNDKVVTQVNKS